MPSAGLKIEKLPWRSVCAESEVKSENEQGGANERCNVRCNDRCGNARRQSDAEFPASETWVLADVPFGGAKQLGIGTELGEEGLAEFTQLRIVNVAL